MQANKIPHHIGIIMDGNGRWATARGKDRTYGHKFGSENVDRIVEHAFNRGVNVVTLYAFSTENWQRPEKEVKELMRLLNVYFKKFLSKVLANGVKLNVVGDCSVLSEKLQKTIKNAEQKSSESYTKTLNIAINYGGRQEIVMAVNKLIELGQPITVENISNNLYTASSLEPDLIIRTGGEKRLSNFLLFQGAYSELYFTDVLWPDFDCKQLDIALEEYANRNRRFGKI